MIDRRALIGGFAACCASVARAQQGDPLAGRFGGPFDLVASKGRHFTDRDFRGKFMLIYFGYTRCPDVCPVNLLVMSQALGLLGADAERIQPLFITVDPERDTPDVLKAYVTGFDPRFLGLSGTPEQIKKAASSFKAYYAKTGVANGTYSMDHTASFYLIDPKGESRVLLNNNAGAEAIAHDVKLLLH